MLLVSRRKRYKVFHEVVKPLLVSLLLHTKMVRQDISLQGGVNIELLDLNIVADVECRVPSEDGQRPPCPW